MRSDPERLRFEIDARDGDARAGVLHTGHGPVRTPAFVPLATKATVRGLDSADPREDEEGACDEEEGHESAEEEREKRRAKRETRNARGGVGGLAAGF